MDPNGFVPDILDTGLNIVFVGFNPGIRSGETGHHFANPTNRFWKILFKVGLTPRLYTPAEDGLLLELGFGITNIVSRCTRAAADIKPEEFARGRAELLTKLNFYRSRVVCLVGKGVFQAYSGRKSASWGFQTDNIIPGSKDFVAPNTSGLVRMNLNELVEIYRLLLT